MSWFYFSEGIWLVQVSLVPCVLAALTLSLSAAHAHRSRLKALLVAFFAVALAGSAGAVAVQASRFGLDRVNVSGYLTWCWVYAAIFLPLSYPLTRLLHRIIQRLSNATGIV